MKIVKVLSKKIEGKEYTKYIVNLPKEVVKDSELLNKKLRARAKKEKIIIEKDNSE